MAESYSSVLFMARECYVYRVPPRNTSAGYRAGEWGDMDKSLWTGRMRVVEYSDHCEIRLEDNETGELFAAAPYDVSGKSVEPVLDSSRYFVLRVERRKAVLAGQTEEDDDDDAPPKPSPHLPAGPKQDFSLMDGETLSIKTPALHGKVSQHTTQTRPGFVMPPPPSAKR
ncbi:hypothetical protein MYAM1_001930 [Malassezia yamatoensis]|uniref:NECAP PHear domain-containing protein n=1 Tax=Malassezia yamatoensis TaxID=253288 RepID=A0AAJ5YUY8_9BASI|nr:hypothetical protein MYAM1_001930 [Malassezia yamatoensis]